MATGDDRQTKFTEDELDGLSPEEKAAILDTDPSEEAGILQDVIDDAGDDDDEGDAADDQGKVTDEAKPDDKADDKPADKPALQEFEAQAEQRTFQPKMAVEAVVDFDKQMADIKTAKAELRQKLDDGELDLNAYEQQKDELVSQETQLLVKQNLAIHAEKQNVSTAEQRWEWQQEQFFSAEANALYQDKYMMAALNEAVKDLASDPKHGDKDGNWFLLEADKLIRERFGKPAPKAQQDKRKPDFSNLPKTLANIPAAENSETGATEFSHLDKLSGMDLERALNKLTPEQQDRYLMAES